MGILDSMLSNEPIKGEIGSTVTADIEEKVTVKKKGKKRAKKEITLKRELSDFCETLNLEILDDRICRTTELLSIKVGSTYIETSGSFIEALGFLLGCLAYTKVEALKDSFVLSYIFDDNIKLVDRRKKYIDADFEKGLTLWNIDGVDFMLEVCSLENVLRSIRGVIRALEIPEGKVELTLQDNRKMQEFELFEANQLRKYGEPLAYEIYEVEVYGALEDAESVEIGIAKILNYLASVFKDKYELAFFGGTEDNVVGVTRDRTDYLGIMKCYEIYNTGLYYYSNGVRKKEFIFLEKVMENLAIADGDIKFKYRTVKFK